MPCGNDKKAPSTRIVRTLPRSLPVNPHLPGETTNQRPSLKRITRLSEPPRREACQRLSKTRQNRARSVWVGLQSRVPRSFDDIQDSPDLPQVAATNDPSLTPRSLPIVPIDVPPTSPSVP
ncbi:hypothetical protein FRC08_000440 [Ceratobasidium sp. 394]|nr:hypothetical protein FRC08_000440 [Ceratobasidium sp. 394]